MSAGGNITLGEQVDGQLSVSAASLQNLTATVLQVGASDLSSGLINIAQAVNLAGAGVQPRVTTLSLRSGASITEDSLTTGGFAGLKVPELSLVSNT